MTEKTQKKRNNADTDGRVSEQRIEEILDKVTKGREVTLDEEKNAEIAKECLIKIVKEDEELSLVDEEELDIESSLTDEEEQKIKDYYKSIVKEKYKELVFAVFMSRGDGME